MMTALRLNRKSLSVACALLMTSLPTHATSISDSYIGGNAHGLGDVIGSTALYQIFGAELSVTGNLLTVSIHTTFAGEGDDGNAAAHTFNGNGIGYGDLFLSSSWNPHGNPGYLQDNAATGTVWQYGFALDNRWMNENQSGTGTLYSLNSNDNLLDSLRSDNFMSGATYRNGQEVAVNLGSAGVSALNGGSWDIDSSNDVVNFYIDLTGTGLQGSDIAIHWGMTCGNDVIEGIAVSAVPVPAAVWLFASGLLMLTGLARRRAV